MHKGFPYCLLWNTCEVPTLFVGNLRNATETPQRLQLLLFPIKFQTGTIYQNA